MILLHTRFRSGDKLNQDEFESLQAELTAALVANNRTVPTLGTDLIENIGLLEAALPTPNSTATSLAGLARLVGEPGSQVVIRSYGPDRTHPEAIVPETAEAKALMAGYEAAHRDPSTLSDFLAENRKALLRLLRTSSAA